MGWCGLVQGRQTEVNSVDGQGKGAHHDGESVDFAALTLWVP